MCLRKLEIPIIAYDCFFVGRNTHFREEYITMRYLSYAFLFPKQRSNEARDNYFKTQQRTYASTKQTVHVIDSQL